MPRSIDVLAHPNGYLSGGSHITSKHDDGLMPLLRGVAERPPRAPVISDYELEVTDEDTILEVDPDGGTVTITVPDDDDFEQGFFVQVVQISDGTVAIESEAGVTLNVFADVDPITLAGQWASIALNKRAADAWLVTGQLA